MGMFDNITFATGALSGQTWQTKSFGRLSFTWFEVDDRGVLWSREPDWDKIDGEGLGVNCTKDDPMLGRYREHFTGKAWLTGPDGRDRAVEFSGGMLVGWAPNEADLAELLRAARVVVDNLVAPLDERAAGLIADLGVALKPFDHYNPIPAELSLPLRRREEPLPQSPTLYSGLMKAGARGKA